MIVKRYEIWPLAYSHCSTEMSTIDCIEDTKLAQHTANRAEEPTEPPGAVAFSTSPLVY